MSIMSGNWENPIEALMQPSENLVLALTTGFIMFLIHRLTPKETFIVAVLLQCPIYGWNHQVKKSFVYFLSQEYVCDQAHKRDN